MKLALVAVAVACACAVAPPVSPLRTVPADTAQQCTNVCAAMGLTMAAVVVVADKSGCVCEPSAGQGPHAAGAFAATAGTIIALEEEAADRDYHFRQLQPPPTQQPFFPQ
jgi:hypothetical protein